MRIPTEEMSQKKLEEELTEAKTNNEIIAAIGKIYWMIYRLNLNDGTYENISVGDDVHHATGESGDAAEALEKMCQTIVAKDWQPLVRQFVDITTLSERMEDAETLTTEYQTKEGEWHLSRFIVNSRDENHRVTHVLYMSTVVDENKRKELQNHMMMDALCFDFTSAYLCDLVQDTYEIVKKSKGSLLDQHAEEVLGAAKGYQELVDYAAKRYLMPDSESQYRRNFNMVSLRERLSMQNIYTTRLHYVKNQLGMEYFECRVVKLFADAKHFQVMVGYRPIDDIIAAEKRQQERLQTALEQAEDANRAKSRFLLNMSHDIRKPMNAILAQAQLLEHFSDYPERVKDYAEKISDAANDLMSLLTNVLEMASIESGKSTLEECVVSAQELNDEIFDACKRTIAKKDIQFTRTLHFYHENIYCDPTKIREIILNLLGNAFQYTMPGGKVELRVEELPSDREGVILMRTEVEDTGIGMSKEFQEQVFDVFSREADTTENGKRGAGLSMAITKNLVEAMGGSISVQSEPGKGSIFRVVIPHRIAD